MNGSPEARLVQPPSLSIPRVPRYLYPREPLHARCPLCHTRLHMSGEDGEGHPGCCPHFLCDPPLPQPIMRAQ